MDGLFYIKLHFHLKGNCLLIKYYRTDLQFQYVQRVRVNTQHMTNIQHIKIENEKLNDPVNLLMGQMSNRKQ